MYHPLCTSQMIHSFTGIQYNVIQYAALPSMHSGSAKSIAHHTLNNFIIFVGTQCTSAQIVIYALTV